jgi:IS605 OrfB family transposase
LVSGRAIRAEHRLHLADTKQRRRATARRAPKRGQRGSRRWRKTRTRTRAVEGRHRRRVRQAQHEAARTVVDWAVASRVGTLTVGDPRSVLDKDAGRRHNLRLRQWQIGRLIAVLTDKATLAGITVHPVNERGTSSTCPTCLRKIPKPRGRVLTCDHCGTSGHRDLLAAAIIATRTPGGAPTTHGSIPLPKVVTHRRAGRHLPGVGTARRTGPLASRGLPHHPGGESLDRTRGEDPQHQPKRVNVSGHGTRAIEPLHRSINPRPYARRWVGRPGGDSRIGDKLP